MTPPDAQPAIRLDAARPSPARPALLLVEGRRTPPLQASAATRPAPERSSETGRSALYAAAALLLHAAAASAGLFLFEATEPPRPPAAVFDVILLSAPAGGSAPAPNAVADAAAGRADAPVERMQPEPAPTAPRSEPPASTPAPHPPLPEPNARRAPSPETVSGPPAPPAARPPAPPRDVEPRATAAFAPSAAPSSNRPSPQAARLKPTPPPLDDAPPGDATPGERRAVDRAASDAAAAAASQPPHGPNAERLPRARASSDAADSTDRLSGAGQTAGLMGAGASTPPSWRLGSRANPAPNYPYTARMRGWEGRVLLRVTVLPDGTVAAIEISESAGRRTLDDAAREAVATWRFTPARRGGETVRATVLVPIQFKLL